jgi:two-component system cell cycle response regulator
MSVPGGDLPVNAEGARQRSFGLGGPLLAVLVSPDLPLIRDVQQILEELGVRLQVETDVEAALVGMGAMPGPMVILLDARLPGMINGRLLLAMQETGVHKRCAVALIAEQVSDEWIARLREGVIDDIVPRYADASTWNTHLNTMQRGHALHCELEQLREAAVMELEHDRVTGVFNREAMLAILFRETDRVQRLRGALCTVLMDVDDFDHWKTELGEASCDGLLREIAVRTGRILRSYDVLGRVGRDEFLIALPGCSTINAVMLAERMRLDVFGEPFRAQDRNGVVVLARLSASVGIAASRGRSPVVVLREAERTLEEAKGMGPDSIRVAGEISQSWDFATAALELRATGTER